MYHIKAHRFINSVIRQRKLILKKGKSHKEASVMNGIIEELERYLNFYEYNSNEKMAKFFDRQSDNIYLLIPGVGKETKRHQDFYLLLTQTQNILNNAESINAHITTNQNRVAAIS